MTQAIAGRWGGLDLWAHCAVHAAPMSPAPHIEGRDWSKSMLVNVEVTRGLIAMLLEPSLRQRRGTALFFDDARGGQKFFGAYGASKAAQIALARSWQAETVQTGPRVLDRYCRRPRRPTAGPRAVPSGRGSRRAGTVQGRGGAHPVAVVRFAARGGAGGCLPPAPPGCHTWPSGSVAAVSQSRSCP